MDCRTLDAQPRPSVCPGRRRRGDVLASRGAARRICRRSRRCCSLRRRCSTGPTSCVCCSQAPTARRRCSGSHISRSTASSSQPSCGLAATSVGRWRRAGCSPRSCCCRSYRHSGPINPQETAQRAVAVLGSSLFGYYAATQVAALHDTCACLALTATIAARLSVFLIVFVPSMGRMSEGEYVNVWSGAWIHKNGMGQMCGLGVLDLPHRADDGRCQAQSAAGRLGLAVNRPAPGRLALAHVAIGDRGQCRDAVHRRPFPALRRALRSVHRPAVGARHCLWRVHRHAR